MITYGAELQLGLQLVAVRRSIDCPALVARSEVVHLLEDQRVAGLEADPGVAVVLLQEALVELVKEHMAKVQE
jgi:hypothetical protein